MKTCLLAAAALLAAAGPLQAQGQEDDSRTVTISYHDLDLTRPDGRSALDRRLRQAVRDACRGTTPDGRPIVPDGPLVWVSLAHCERATLAPAREAAALAAAAAERRLRFAERSASR